MFCSIVVIRFLLLILKDVLSSSGQETNETRVTFDNHQLFRVFTVDPQFADRNGWMNIQIVDEPTRRSLAYDVIVPPESVTTFKQDLVRQRLGYNLYSTDVQEIIESERFGNEVSGDPTPSFALNRYHTYEEINQWIRDIEQEFPEVTMFNIGQSFRGRDTLGLRLSRRPNNSAIFLETGVHAREWISPATTIWMFDNLLRSNDSEVQRLSMEYDWYFVPLGNPDGYVYSWTVNRLWRKNRKREGLCVGTDVNRNFDYRWREVGASAQPCSDTYAGVSGNSEVETTNLINFVRTIQGTLKLYVSLHSYTQLLLYPEGHTAERIPEYDDYERIGQLTVEAIARRYGTQYERGNINEVIYPVSGGSTDYMRSVLGIPLAFVFELRPTRDTPLGFVLSPSEIVPSGEETFDGLAAMVNEAQVLGYFN